MKNFLVIALLTTFHFSATAMAQSHVSQNGFIIITPPAHTGPGGSDGGNMGGPQMIYPPPGSGKIIEQDSTSKKACLAYFKEKLNAEALEKKADACGTLNVRDSINNNTKFGAPSLNQYESCFNQWRILEKENTHFVKDCANSYESNILVSSKFNNCYNQMKPMIGNGNAYEFCIRPSNMDSANSPSFATCLEKTKKSGVNINQSVDKCKDSWYRDMITSPQYEQCTSRLGAMGIAAGPVNSICGNDSARNNIGGKNFTACAKFFETNAKSGPYEQAALCSNQEILNNYQNRQACYVASLNTAFKNYAYYGAFSTDAYDRGYFYFLNKDCSSGAIQGNPKTASGLRLIREINISSGEFFADDGNIRIGGVSGMSFDREKKLLYMLSDENMQMSGLASRIYAFSLTPEFNLTESHLVSLKSADAKSLKMDPEGLARLSNGNFVISSELEKSSSKSVAENLNVFSADGKWLEALTLPPSFQTKYDNEEQRKNSKGVNYSVVRSGLEFNKSLESLTVAPSNAFLFTANEAPLIQDQKTMRECAGAYKPKKSKGSGNGTAANGGFQNVAYDGVTVYGNDWASDPGANSDGGNHDAWNDRPSKSSSTKNYYVSKDCGGSVRIAKYRVNEKKGKKEPSYVFESEYRYDLDNEVDNGLSELLAFDDNRLLALERSFDNVKQKVKARIYMITLAQANPLPAGIELTDKDNVPAVQKQLVLDLDEVIPALAPGFKNIDNFEAMALGPQLSNGNATLILGTDNNFRKTQRTSILFFEIPKQ